jgi:hypothetical protein
MDYVNEYHIVLDMVENITTYLLIVLHYGLSSSKGFNPTSFFFEEAFLMPKFVLLNQVSKNVLYFEYLCELLL